MKKFKVILQFNIILIIIVLLAFLNTFYTITHKIIKSNYSGNEIEVLGIINNIKIDGNKLTIELLAKEKILAYYYFNNEKDINTFYDKFKLGDKLLLKGVFEKPSDNTVFNLFNYRNYLLSKKISWLFQINTFSLIKENQQFKYKIKSSIYNHIDKINYSKHYVKAFIIGVNEDINHDIIHSYQKIGVNHLFAVSGMHVTILSTIILKMCNLFLKNKKGNYIIAIILILIYAFINNFSPSVLRASLMFILLTINKQLNLNIRSSKVLLLILSFLLLYNPYYIYSVGFCFTFIICFYLIISSVYINKYRNYFVRVFITSVISFLAGFPILTTYFFEINLLSPFFNLIFVPFINFIIFPLTLIVFLLPIFDKVLYIFIIVLENLSQFCLNLNYFILILAKPHIIATLLYYLILILIITKQQKRYFLLFLILFTVHYNIKIFDFNYKITMIDVGQGDSILIELPNNKSNILIDTGGKIKYEIDDWKKKKREYSIGKDTIIPFLKSKGIKKIDYLILTHGDYDHAGEAITIINNFKISNVLLNDGTINNLEQEIINRASKKQINYQIMKKSVIKIDKIYFNFLNIKDYNNENENSLIIYTKINSKNILLTGDIGKETEKDLIKEYKLPKMDILKVGHHGSKNSSSESFLNAIHPSYALISAGRNNSFNHPHPDVLSLLNALKINYFITSVNGSIELIIKGTIIINTCL